jgi:hypothetical protein
VKLGDEQTPITVIVPINQTATLDWLTPLDLFVEAETQTLVQFNFLPLHHEDEYNFFAIEDHSFPSIRVG